MVSAFGSKTGLIEENTVSKFLTLQPKAIDGRTLKHKAFRIEFRSGYVHVVLDGTAKTDGNVQNDYWREIKETCEKHNCRKVLVEGVAPRGERSSGEIIGAGLRTGTVRELWLAYCLEGFHETEESALYETIAATRGVRVKFFSEKQRALEWLRINAKDDPV